MSEYQDNQPYLECCPHCSLPVEETHPRPQVDESVLGDLYSIERYEFLPRDVLVNLAATIFIEVCKRGEEGRYIPDYVACILGMVRTSKPCGHCELCIERIVMKGSA